MLNRTKPDRLPRRLCLLLLAALLALALAGCGETETAEVPEETPAPVYALRYWLGDKLLQTQTLAEGQYPAHLELSFSGLRFVGWSTDDGTLAQPEQSAMTADVDYHAVIYPMLDNHVPYLFPDADGFLLPDAPLTSRARRGDPRPGCPGGDGLSALDFRNRRTADAGRAAPDASGALPRGAGRRRHAGVYRQ